MDINRIRIVDDAAEIGYNMNKALAILGDLLQDYAFVHKIPTEKEIERISRDSSKIIMFICIAYDYLTISQTGIKGLLDEIEMNIH